MGEHHPRKRLGLSPTALHFPARCGIIAAEATGYSSRIGNPSRRKARVAAVTV
jgi:hypothetical protein